MPPRRCATTAVIKLCAPAPATYVLPVDQPPAAARALYRIGLPPGTASRAANARGPLRCQKLRCSIAVPLVQLFPLLVSS